VPIWALSENKKREVAGDVRDAAMFLLNAQIVKI